MGASLGQRSPYARSLDLPTCGGAHGARHLRLELAPMGRSYLVPVMKPHHAGMSFQFVIPANAGIQRLMLLKAKGAGLTSYAV
mgnify:CR=1 FL=1